ncbi:Uncharacterized protein Rs2_40929 [Raphanus sativus]|nr:Uncharacterized protein Rs2_40929 [Raphanus sativus]
MEVAELTTDNVIGQESSTKQTEVQGPTESVEEDNVLHGPFGGETDPANEASLTIPQNNSPSARRRNGKYINTSDTEHPTTSPSRYQILSTELEEGEVEEDSFDEETSVESQAAMEKKKQFRKAEVWNE